MHLTIVSPFYNEEAGILAFCEELRNELDKLPVTYTVILVNDGSTDKSLDLLRRELDWHECEVLSLGRNFGHQNALDVGIRHALGDFVVTMDSDLQHPPSLLSSMLTQARKGYDVVYAIRLTRNEEGWFKLLTSKVYYILIRLLSGVDLIPNAADFRLMSRRVVDQLNSLDEKKVFRLLIPSMGYKSSTISFKANIRVHGETRYSFRKMVQLALNSAVMFSSKPLTMIGLSGVFVSLCTTLLMLFNLWEWSRGNVIPGWTSVTLIILFIGGLQLLGLGILGVYLGNIFEMSKKRPHSYVVDKFRLDKGLKDRESNSGY
jgi:dolichol-phosphate mannosyltransferase